MNGGKKDNNLNENRKECLDYWPKVILPNVNWSKKVLTRELLLKGKDHYGIVKKVNNIFDIKRADLN